MAFINKEKPAPPPPQQPAGKRPDPAPSAEQKPKPKPAKPKTPSPWPWGPLVRTLVSLAVIFHLTAVFTAPWYIQLWPVMDRTPMVEPGGVPRDQYGRPLSPEQAAAIRFPIQSPVLPRLFNTTLRHYANLLYINSGYDFFSPDPSVSHLIRYEVFDAAGQPIAKGQFPDRREQWPRLLYHRHMMLVEQSADFGGPGSQGQSFLYRIADGILAKHGGDRVRLTYLRHHLLTPEQALAGQRIDGEPTYEQLEVIEHRRRATSAPATSAIPMQGGWR